MLKVIANNPKRSKKTLVEVYAKINVKTILRFFQYILT
jgi:hypothetical protein